MALLFCCEERGEREGEGGVRAFGPGSSAPYSSRQPSLSLSLSLSLAIDALGSNSTGPSSRSCALRIFGEPAELTTGDWLDSPQARRKSPSKAEVCVLNG